MRSAIPPTAPSRVRLQLHAKVNWTLEILGRRDDGFHELRSWFVAIALFDRLEAQVISERASRLEVQAAEHLSTIPNDERNLVLQAEATWRKHGGQAPQLAWRLVKTIPSGAGLGGGSSNAAGALQALERVAEVPLGFETCLELAAELGSDVPFFLQGRGAELRGGRGERSLARAPAPSCWLVVAVPEFSVSTPKVYAASQAERCPTRLEEKKPGLSPTPQANDLRGAAYRAYPELEAFAARLGSESRFELCGSGGAHFACFDSREEADALAQRVRSISALVHVVPTLPTPAPPFLT